MIKVIYILLLCSPIISYSQNNIKYQEGVKNLVDRFEKKQSKELVIRGWRIQIAFANKKTIITKKKIKLINRLPEINSIYITYKSPYYRLRIGNFRTKLEAEKIKHEIKKYYPNAYLVPDNIPIRELEY